MEPLPLWRVGIHARIWLCVGISLPLGLVALSLRLLGIFVGDRVVLGTRQYDGKRWNRDQLAGFSSGGPWTARVHCPGAAYRREQRASAFDFGRTDRRCPGIHSWRPDTAGLPQRDKPLRLCRADRTGRRRHGG